MPALRELQSRFIDYLTGDSGQPDPAIQGNDHNDRRSRLDIYRNAYRIRLREAMQTDHEILWTYIGDDLFAQLVDGYISSHPSHYTSLRNFSDHLPAYLASTAPFDQHPVIAGIAVFERLLMDVFDAADAELTDLAALRELDPGDWPGMRLRFHPAVQLHKAQWNSVECWKALKEESAPPAATDDRPRYWVLWRDAERLSQFRPLEENEYVLLSLAIKGESFSGLCEALLQWHAPGDVSMIALRYITGWLEQGLITELQTSTDPEKLQVV